MGIFSLSHVCPPTPRWRWSSCHVRAMHGPWLQLVKWPGHNHSSGFWLPTTSTNCRTYSSIALTFDVYAAASVIKDKPRHSTEQQTNIEGSENECKFQCFIRCSNFRTSLNIPKLFYTMFLYCWSGDIWPIKKCSSDLWSFKFRGHHST